MVKASNKTLDEEIRRSLRDVCLLLGVDRGGLLDVWEDSPIVKLTHAWYDSGVTEVSGEMNLAELFPWCYRKLVPEGEAKVIERLEDFPPEATKDRQSHLLLGTKSSLVIPLFIGPRIHHLIAIESTKEHRAWPGEIIRRLRLLGEIFVSALQRREADGALRRAKDRLNLAAASANAALWELDLGTGLLWMTEKSREMFGFAADQEVSLERFLKDIPGDDQESIRAAINEACCSGREISVEYRVVSPDGRFRWMASRGRVQAGVVDGRPRLMGVTFEMTERKEIEMQLQEQIREIERLRSQLEMENAYLRNEMAMCDDRRELLGAGVSMRAIMTQVEQVARTGSTVLIQGETGTGKELVAQTIHRLSDRSRREMVKVNCAALPAALVESELFGREKGAFTGALSRQAGRFELADGSTLFLDEIAEIPLETQAKLLRVLQEGEFERLGSPKTIKGDVRVIAATNRNLADEVEKGRFRRDLYYRLNVFPIQVPPLREHPEDIPKLVWEFVNEFGERMGKKIRRIAASDMQALAACSWPGNIRELRNVIEHSMIVSQGETLELYHLSHASQSAAAPTTLEEVERRHIQATLKATNGRVKGAGGAAEILGLNPSTLYSRMQKLGINSTHS
jgi:PAS domain S-box-containing protein